MARALRFLQGWIRCGTYHIVVAALLLIPLLQPVLAREPTEAVLEVSVNGTSGGETLVVLRGEGNEVWLLGEDLARLHLKRPTTPPLVVGGHQYYSIAAIDHSRIDIDESSQHASLTVPASAFEATRLHTTSAAAAAITPAEPGAFLNYQLSGQHVEGDTSGGALAELGIFASPGVFTNSGIERTAAGVSQGVRLDSTFKHDFTGRLETLALGDAISDPGSWGSAVRYAGIHWGTNFGIRPDLITTPLLTAGGTAVVPSTVDVLVNGQRVSSQEVPAGPFIIDRLPVVTGAGDVRLIVRNALGQEQTITEPFYSGPSLLAAGLSQYAVDVGVARENYTLTSFDYGSAVASASYRRGLTDWLTFEGHGEMQSGDAHALGFDLASRAGNWGIASLTLAEGGSGHESGLLSGLSLEHRGRRLSLLLSTLYAGDGFHRIGDTAPGVAPFKSRSLAQVGVNVGHSDSLSIAWVAQTYRASPAQQVLSASYSRRIGASGWLALTATRTSGAQASNGAYLNYTLALAQRRTLSTDALAGNVPGQPRHEVLMTLAQNAPVGPGDGWRIGAASTGDYDASWQHGADAFDMQLQAARNVGESGQRGLLRGAFTLLDGDFRPTRTVTGSFAVVDVAGLPDVPVYLENQLIGRTDDSGRVMLHDLRSYEPNRVSVAPNDLPLDTSIAGDRIVLLPPYRSGVVARFPITRSHGGTFRLVTPRGEPLPAGALVRFNGGTFPVALDGLTYVDTLDHGTVGEASWGESQHCRFRMPAPPPGDPLPDMGTIVCGPAPAGHGGTR
jgi:outer membrane usher protein